MTLTTLQIIIIFSVINLVISLVFKFVECLYFKGCGKNVNQNIIEVV